MSDLTARMSDLTALRLQEEVLLAEKRAAEERLDAKRAEIRQAEGAIQAVAFRDPQPGDRWHEMLSFWLYVVDRDGDQVTVQYSGPPCTFPEDATEETVSLEEWRRRWYYMHLSERGNDVAGWKGKAREVKTELPLEGR
jgi:hypothetical protein